MDVIVSLLKIIYSTFSIDRIRLRKRETFISSQYIIHSFLTSYDLTTTSVVFLTAIFNSSLREGVIPNEWKMANVIPLPKTKPMISVEKDIRPISLTPIVATVFESIVLGWVDDIVSDRIDDNQFGGVGGTSITDALVEMTHNWYEATDVLNNYVRVVLLDFSKAFDLINHHILVDKLITNGIPAHIVRWLAAFLLDRQQQVKIGNIYSRTGSPNGGVPQGTLSGPKCCFIIY